MTETTLQQHTTNVPSSLRQQHRASSAQHMHAWLHDTHRNQHCLCSCMYPVRTRIPHSAATVSDCPLAHRHNASHSVPAAVHMHAHAGTCGSTVGVYTNCSHHTSDRQTKVQNSRLPPFPNTTPKPLQWRRGALCGLTARCWGTAPVPGLEREASCTAKRVSPD